MFLKPQHRHLNKYLQNDIMHRIVCNLLQKHIFDFQNSVLTKDLMKHQFYLYPITLSHNPAKLASKILGNWQLKEDMVHH